MLHGAIDCCWGFLAPCPAMLATLGVAATCAATLLIWRRHETTMMALKWLFYVISICFNMENIYTILGYPILTHTQTSCTFAMHICGILFFGDTYSRWDDVRPLVSFLFVDNTLQVSSSLFHSMWRNVHWLRVIDRELMIMFYHSV